MSKHIYVCKNFSWPFIRQNVNWHLSCVILFGRFFFTLLLSTITYFSVIFQSSLFHPFRFDMYSDSMRLTRIWYHHRFFCKILLTFGILFRSRYLKPQKLNTNYAALSTTRQKTMYNRLYYILPCFVLYRYRNNDIFRLLAIIIT